MFKLRRNCAGALLGVVPTSCGSGTSSTPTAPTVVTPPAPTLVSLSISASEYTLLLGSSQSISANGHYSDGAMRTVAATWTSDTPGVIGVDSTGRISAISAGMASVTASFGGRSVFSVFRCVARLQWTLDLTMA